MIEKKDILFDTRVVEYNLRRGVISPDEYEARLSTLPDDADEGVETNVRFASHAPERSSSDARD